MFERLKRLYEQGKISAEQLQHAVDLGDEWLTEDQKTEIMANTP